MSSFVAVEAAVGCLAAGGWRQGREGGRAVWAGSAARARIASRTVLVHNTCNQPLLHPTGAPPFWAASSPSAAASPCCCPLHPRCSAKAWAATPSARAQRRRGRCCRKGSPLFRLVANLTAMSRCRRDGCELHGGRHSGLACCCCCLSPCILCATLAATCILEQLSDQVPALIPVHTTAAAAAAAGPDVPAGMAADVRVCGQQPPPGGVLHSAQPAQ